MWLKSGQNKFPILSILDSATKYQAVSLLQAERTDCLVEALKRCWIAHFGPPAELLTDEGRGWLSDDFTNFTDEHSIQHTVAPGEAHERLSLVERRHAVLRKSCELYLKETGQEGGNAVRESLIYVVPQLNAQPNASGYSPSQWLLGQQPQFPGDLLNTALSPLHLEGSKGFEEELQKRAIARMAIIQTDVDRKLRRGLLRRYFGNSAQFQPGQLCFYWRDARAPDLVKIRWKGPARVLMREDDSEGRPQLYWISHKSQLLRCAPHHLRPAIEQDTSTLIEGLQLAKRDMAALRSRGVTRMLDLNVVNRQRLEHVESEEEGEDLEQEEEEHTQPPLQRRRLNAPAGAPQVASPPRPTGDTDMVEVDDTAEYSPTSPAHSQHQQQAEEPQAPEPLALPPERSTPEPLADIPDAELPAVPPSAPPTPSQNEPSEEPSPPPSTSAARIPARPPAPTLDPATAALYQVPQPGETFQLLRNRFDQQETISFGNRRARAFIAPTEPDTECTSSQAVHGAGPYDKPATGSEPLEGCCFELDDLDCSLLPPGWHIENGYITMDSPNQDYWELRAGCLIRYHLVPRRTKFSPQSMTGREMAHLPLPVDRLDDVRITVRRVGSQLHQESDFIQTGNGKPSQQTWTGMTISQVNGETRKEMGMTSHDVQDARQLGRKQRAAANKKIQKNKSEIKERELSLEHRLLFQAAKQKELSSFFQNGVWSLQTTKEASPERTLTSRMLLKWSKNADGSPRAKARLVVRGYADVDALAGSLETASPASTRLGKTLFLSLSSCLGWIGWSADVSTAFLQGLSQERKLWVKLPADALALLGADSDTRMFLHKPVYGQLDAPRRWFLEASSRLRKFGWKQHSLDPCFWMLFEP